MILALDGGSGICWCYSSLKWPRMNGKLPLSHQDSEKLIYLFTMLDELER